MPRLLAETVMWLYALEFDHPDPAYAGLAYVGATYGMKADQRPEARLVEHLERKTRESKRYLPATNFGLRWAGLLYSVRHCDEPFAEGSIRQSYEAVGWCTPQVNKDCGWPLPWERLSLSPEARAKMSVQRKGRHHSAEAIAKMSASKTGKHYPRLSEAARRRIVSPETCAKIAATLKGRPGRRHTSEQRAAMSVSQKGKIIRPESVAKMLATKKGKTYPKVVEAALRRKGTPGTPWTSETRTRMMRVLVGHAVSEETRAKISAANKGRPSPNKGVPRSPECCAKMSAALKGKPGHASTAETNAKISAALTGRTLSMETRAKISASKRSANAARRTVQDVVSGKAHAHVA